MARLHIFSTSKDPREAGRPGRSKLQDFIYQLDVGAGVTVLKGLLFLVGVLFLMLLHFVRFNGLKEPEAMDMAQVGRNMARGEGYTTNLLRPYSLWYLEFARGRGPQVERHPELFRAPMYPWLLSKVFAFPGWTHYTGAINAVKGDRIVVMCSLIWILPSLVLIYLLGSAWFDRRVALLSVWIYALSNATFAEGISGTPIPFLTFVLLASLYFLALAMKQQEAERKKPIVIGLCLVLSAAFLAAGALTRYGFLPWIVPGAVCVWRTFKARGGLFLALYLVVFWVPVGQWMMNRMALTGSPLGLAGTAIKEGTRFLPQHELMRRHQTEAIQFYLSRVSAAQIARKALANTLSLVEDSIKSIGGNFIIIFFLACWMHPFRRPEVARVLRCVIAALGMAVAICALTDGEAGGLLQIFYPMAILFGVAFFWILFDRLDLTTRLKRAAVVGVFIAANAAPLALSIVSRPPSPYPPVKFDWIERFNGGFASNEQIATDIPWAVAWYADRHAVWVPWTRKEFLDLHDSLPFNLTGLYLTQQSLHDTAHDSAFVRNPVDLERPWALMSMGIPMQVVMIIQGSPGGGFPLNEPYPFDFSNVLYTDKKRWGFAPSSSAP
jgi:hypothetical protein